MSQPMRYDAADLAHMAHLTKELLSRQTMEQLWTAAPGMLFDAKYETETTSPTAPQRAKALAGHWGTITASDRGLTVLQQDDVLFLYDAENVRRTLQPIMDHRQANGASEPMQLDQPVSASTLARHTAGARSATRALRRVWANNDHAEPAALVGTMRAAARSLARAEGVLAQHKPQLIVVATQHGTSARAYIAASRRMGIPSVYFPHAPVARNVQYEDLPTDRAGLRGQGEVNYYRSLGVSADLDVVGNPAAPEAPEISLDLLPSGGPVVFAPSPVPAAMLAPQVALLTEALGDQVVLAPHPAMSGRPEYESLWPNAWAVHQGRTLDLIADGATCVIQCSSGVAWEALAHGVATVELALTDALPNYPLIVDPEVTFVRSAPELRQAVDAAAQSGPDHRAGRIAWATQWCDRTGPDAVAAAADLVEEARSNGPQPQPLWDAWREL